MLGDTVGIYDTSCNKVGGYAYDAWCNCTITFDINGIATKNRSGTVVITMTEKLDYITLMRAITTPSGADLSRLMIQAILIRIVLMA